MCSIYASETSANVENVDRMQRSKSLVEIQKSGFEIILKDKLFFFRIVKKKLFIVKRMIFRVKFFFLT